MKKHIKEIIVVEGKDDVSAVRRAVDATILTTSGMGWRIWTRSPRWASARERSS